jgi:hypothetical protein
MRGFLVLKNFFEQLFDDGSIAALKLLSIRGIPVFLLKASLADPAFPDA